MLYKNTAIYPYLFTYCNITSAYTYPTGLEPLKTLENQKRIRLMAISSDYSGKLGTVFESLKTLAVFEFKIYDTDVSGSKKFWVLT